MTKVDADGNPIDDGDEDSGDKDGDKASVSRAEFDKVLKGLSDLTTLSTRNSSLMSDLLDKIANKDSNSDDKDEDKGGKNKADDKGDDLSNILNVDSAHLESLSRRDFAEFILRNAAKITDGAVVKAVKPLEERVGNVASVSATNDIKAAIKEARSAHKDFDDWKDEIRNLAKSNPQMDIEDMYLLARAKDSKKAKEVDAKYGKADDDSNVKKKGKFGGFAPGGASNTARTKKMSMKDAGQAAWDEVMADFPSS